MKQLKKQYDMLGYTLHQANNSPDIFEKIIEEYTMEKICSINHNGIISNLLEYFIKTDNNKIEILLSYITVGLMKRDYMHLIKYYYDNNILDSAIDMFQNNIITQFELLQQDVDYILINRMFKLLPFMEGLFLKTSYITDNFVMPCASEVKLFLLGQKQIDDILEQIIKETNINIITRKEYGAIIDGGSVIHSRHGKITSDSMNDLITISNVAKVSCGEPIVIIHKRHTKTIKNLEKELQKNVIDYFLTPYNMNDDMFILHFFLSLGTKPHIITNDKFRDHIYKFEKSKNNIMNMSMFKDVILQQTLTFDITRNWLDFKPDISYCIQKYKDGIIIPHIMEQFIFISLKE